MEKSEKGTQVSPSSRFKELATIKGDQGSPKKFCSDLSLLISAEFETLEVNTDSRTIYFSDLSSFVYEVPDLVQPASRTRICSGISKATPVTDFIGSTGFSTHGKEGRTKVMSKQNGTLT